MKKKVLLIDDDEDLLRSLQVTLQSKGFEVSTATDSKKGLNKLMLEKPHILVLDVMMNTNLEGYNLLHSIKKDPEFKKLPIIMLTGMADAMGVNLYSGVEDEAMFPHVRFQDKPIDPLLLVDMINEMTGD
jgi:DNA-binding response OmpR family regulator